MTGKRMPANNFPGTCLLEALGRTLMGFQLWHINFLDVSAVGVVPLVTAFFDSTTARPRLNAPVGRTARSAADGPVGLFARTVAADKQLTVARPPALLRSLHRELSRRPLSIEFLGMSVADLLGVGSAFLVFAEEFIVRLPQGGLTATITQILGIRVNRRNSVSVGIGHGRGAFVLQQRGSQELP
jgi:hypothetical protein